MKPNIGDYINIFQFLQDFYVYRKKKEPGFSYATWSKELGIKNKSYLRFVILGKRPISTNMAKTLKESLGFEPKEKKIFDVLSLYTQSKSDEERKLIGKELIKLLRKMPHQEEIETHHEMLMNPLSMMIRTLLTFKDLKKTPDQLADMLDTPLSEVTDSLEVLQRLGLIELKDGSYVSRQNNLKIPDSFNNLGLETFHKKSFQAAAASMNLPKDTRRFRSWFVALDEEKLLQFISQSENAIREKILFEDSDHFQD